MHVAKILIVHNFYQQRGGEDAVFAAEKSLLRQHKHEVIEFQEDNKRIPNMNRVDLAIATVWSKSARRRLEGVLKEEKPDIVHFHNTFPLISPSVYYACRTIGVPVVQTLHNYRLLCPGGNFYRDTGACQECLAKLPWPGVFHACYHESHVATSVVATMLTVHRALGTWSRRVSVFIALTEFARQKFIEGGLPPQRIVVKPNFAAFEPAPAVRPGIYALYLGRLSREKGADTLLGAWRQLHCSIPLRIAGDGPLRSQLETQRNEAALSNISFLGHLERGPVQALLRNARFLIVPSGCYENFPLAVVEAFASGIPVIVPKLGALEEIVQDHRTGLHFRAYDPIDLAAKVEWAWTHPAEMDEMGLTGRAEYDMKYTAERNYEMLMQTYEKAARETL